jgi:hypothetical protein
MLEEDKINLEVNLDEDDGDTLTPSDIPNLSAEPKPTVEEIEAAEPQVVEDPKPVVEMVGEDPEISEEEFEKVLTQSQVNEIVGRTRSEAKEKALREIYDRYGVNGDDELNGIFGKGQAYDALNDEHLRQGSQVKELLAENALLKTGISENRWADAKAILTSKGLEINQDNIMSELQTHPEWKGTNPESPAQKVLTPEMAENMVERTTDLKVEEPSVIRKMGIETPEKVRDTSEEDAFKKLFGLN